MGVVPAESSEEVVMKRLLVCMLALGTIGILMAGCQTDKQKSKSEQTKTEHPAKKAAPKDHPAH